VNRRRVSHHFFYLIGVQRRLKFSDRYVARTPDGIENAPEGAVSTLPHPVSSGHIKSIAETILRSANEGERDPNTLQTMALLELQISPRK
jgi:hypothetical protein